ncbi:hypothetical protein MNBD_UNCLBAC01-419 [hydrothermal vent metagenome]|uniref:HTH cro/C1-type domain-containing protein n=1 Tax=hydrothermal vent metagenome TaxID=652676 RepID=A0A3B1DGD6_9ZZZZ
MYIGKKIKELRKAQKMTLSNLAEKSKVQIATLSRIEHLQMSGTLNSHIQIAKALGVELPALYTDIIKKEDKVEALKPETVSEVFTYNEKSSYDILTNKVLSKKMMPILLKVEPGGETTPEKNLGGTEKFVYVLNGKIDVLLNNKTYALTKSSTLYFDSSVEHSFINNGKIEARVLCVTTPVVL